jgi:hypothetical protein
MLPDIKAATDDLLRLAEDAGWGVQASQVSTEGRSVYLTLSRYDGLHVRVRISDHRSMTFKTGKSWKRRQGWLLRFSVRLDRPGTRDAFVRWLRSHSAQWPREASHA